MKIVVGLGNPGQEYERTPHNAGFAVVDALARAHEGRLRGSWRFRARTGAVAIGAERVLLVQPQTFMNLSGEAVATILRWRKAAPADLLVVVDDADLPLGRIRVRAAGSSGGHRGLGSVIACLGTEAFARVRVGIGRGDAGHPLVDYVLRPPSADDRRRLDDAVALAADAAVCWVREGVDAAMNAYNRRDAREATESTGNGSVPEERKGSGPPSRGGREASG